MLLGFGLRPLQTSRSFLHCFGFEQEAKRHPRPSPLGSYSETSWAAQTVRNVEWGHVWTASPRKMTPTANAPTAPIPVHTV